MIDDKDVIDEGFKPLKKTPTEPQALPSKPNMSRAMSFNVDTGEKESAAELWEDSSWRKMARNRGQSMSRSNTFIGTDPAAATADAESAHAHLDEIVVVVDPFSTGAHLAAEINQRGYKCARVFSAWDSPVASLVQKGLKIDYCATIQHNDRLAEPDKAVAETITALKELPFPIVAILPGAETGVELADQLSARMGLRSNGTAKSLARRNKYYMGEAVRRAGVRAVKQANCSTVAEVKAFLQTLPGVAKKAVVKPVQSAGSDDVFLCADEDEAVTAFTRIHGTMNGLGLQNDCVLVQEYLQGKEYVVDKVSLDGNHKLMAIWEYEKRPVNGANFVYFGMRLVPPDQPKCKVMVAYADQVLDALDIRHGPSHMEIMLDSRPKQPQQPLQNNSNEGDEEVEYLPCLVEVGARCQGGEGTWLSMCKEAVGYTQVEMALDVYLPGATRWQALDRDSFSMCKSCREVDMVSRNGGIVRRMPGDAFIRSLPCFRSLSWDIKPGDYISKTIDCFTRPGCVQLVGPTEEAVERDFEAIHDHELLGMIDYSVICPTPPSVGAVVVVDPFSSGANIAAMVLLWGYKLILVFSEHDSPVASLVAKGNKVEPTLMVQHDNTHPQPDVALKETLEKITSQGSPVLAIIPGAETGVELADNLANHYGTRCNDAELTEARRNKYKMQEVLREQGKIRVVSQKLCRSVSEVEAFVAQLQASSPTKSCKCVIKPNESAGTDSVFLCETLADALEAFHAIHGQINGLGQVNDGALCQEFLSGNEYVVDGVSRDGVYKITAIWAYDKRSVNGANFVYFGMSLKEANKDPKIRAIVEYAKEVVSGLRIFQGPSHMEIICSEVVGGGGGWSPCLVEVGTRCHGGEATWLPVAAECVGYTQLDATLNCYLRPDRFDALPFEPVLHKQGTEAFLVSYNEGTLKDIPGIEALRKLPSFRRMEMLTQPGAALHPTIDCFTRPGSVQMVNASAAQMQADYEQIRTLEKAGMFELL
eukprot:CAMPEP_0174978690 /NCGR_PEP_ID=MMETSP0004_2-20121128/14353_1 /TAXON_ID=420556 /ORGANISM="Ochromonas sp., Strain CCMP1393" /LENGTH=988 /DNA_ID=CAMNT_0016230109 /DNA_START=105 /DNA_END=3071 /DNA_ORIENTATION=+